MTQSPLFFVLHSPTATSMYTHLLLTNMYSIYMHGEEPAAFRKGAEHLALSSVGVNSLTN